MSKPQVKKIKDKDYVAFDIETNTETLELICISLFGNKYQEVFTDYQNFLNFIVKKRVFTLYAFYGGGFDFLLLLDFFRYNPKFVLTGIIEISGLIMYLKFNYFGLEFEFIDAFGLFRGYSLNEVSTNLIGEKKLDVDRTKIQDYSLETIKQYCLNDSRLLYLSLKEFEKEVGFLTLTISQLSLKNFIDTFSTHRKHFYRYGKEQHAELSQWYFGGHVDVFKRYGENLYYYDINSCYAKSMHQFGAIYSFNYIVDKFSDNSEEKGLYEITVEKDLNIPVIPYRYKGEQDIYERIYFLNTRQKLYATSLDLELLETLNVPYKIHLGLMFKWDKDFFKPFVEYWYKKRLESPKLKFIAKLVINSLYGKFGQKIERLSTVIDKNNELPESQIYDDYFRLGRKEMTLRNWFNHPEISAFVTSGARFIHSTLLNQYQNNLYYADTDSLILDAPLEEKYISNKLGDLKLEYNKIERGYFLGNKFYGLFNSNEPLKDDKFNIIVFKGYEFTEDLTEKHFKQALNTGKLNFEYSKKSIKKFKSSLQQNNRFISFVDNKKKIDKVSIKRRIEKDKINTLPYFLTKANKLK